MVIEKNIIVLREGPRSGLDNTAVTAKVKYTVNIINSERKFVLIYTTMQSLVFCMLVV